MTTADVRWRALPGSWRRSPVLLVTAGLSLVGLLVAVIGLAVDDTRITGAPAWLKPAKFGISITVYSLTLAWLLSLVRGHQRVVRSVAITTALALVGEIVLIDLQVVRGTTSHFNGDTPFDARLFSTMGGLIALVFAAALVVAVLLTRQRDLPRPLAAAVRGGVLVALLGMAEAGLMFANTSDDDEGAHTVGAPDGGPGLPLTGWSTEHGDLRVAHFAGLHALQALPLLAWGLARLRPDLPVRRQVALVRLAAAGYAVAVVLLAWQAERGEPLLHPHAPVLATGAAGLVLATVAVAAILRPAVPR